MNSPFRFFVTPLADSKCRLVAWSKHSRGCFDSTVIDMIFISTEIDHFLKHLTFSSRKTVGDFAVNPNSILNNNGY